MRGVEPVAGLDGNDTHQRRTSQRAHHQAHVESDVAAAGTQIYKVAGTYSQHTSHCHNGQEALLHIEYHAEAHG